MLQELGLREGTPVATGLIDAHAGGVGTLESIPRQHASASVTGGYSRIYFDRVCL